MKLRNFWMLGALCGGLLSCSDEIAFQEEEEKVLSEAPFTIYASNGVETRLQYGEDGLSLQWNDQDQLMLVDVTGKLKPIPLTTTLEAPSDKAIFRSETAVPAGTYFVRNVGRLSGIPTNASTGEVMTFGNRSIDYSLGHGYLQNREDLQKDIDLYSEPITVQEGQVSVNVDLKHVYAMIKVNIINADGKWSAKGEKQIGMLCPTKGFPMQCKIMNTNELETSFESPKLPLTKNYSGIDDKTPEDVLTNYAALILPVDLSGRDVYFYVSDLDGMRGEYEKVYEIKKEGIALKAGVCYTINLDLNKATEIEIPEKKLSTPDHFRALAYNSGSSTETYTVVNDIDFEGVDYFPIIVSHRSKTIKIDGGTHTLRNLKINWPFKGAGLLSTGSANEGVIQNLNMESVTITGTECVGAFCGSSGYKSLKNCNLLGSNEITGTGDMVGGLVGGKNSSVGQNFESCTVSKGTKVTGKNFVGGLIGGSGKFSECRSDATVSGVNNVGGLTGSNSGNISMCSSFATVTAEGNNAGGLSGSSYAYAEFKQSSFSGQLKGNDYVGGIVGRSADFVNINLCYSTGTIEGNAYVGGISGSGCGIVDCYSLSKITGTDAETTGGIIADAYSSTIKNCYFAGTISNGCGIAGKAGTKRIIQNCITTAANLSLSDVEADKVYTNLTSIQEKVNIINADLVYATEDAHMWPDVANHCPKFLWQITDGEEHETPVPPYTNGGEW